MKKNNRKKGLAFLALCAALATGGAAGCGKAAVETPPESSIAAEEPAMRESTAAQELTLEEKAAAFRFEALQKKMSGDIAADMMRFKEDIKPFIENDIVSRYYYRRGALLQQAGHDNDVKAATELLANPAEYAKLLKPQK